MCCIGQVGVFTNEPTFDWHQQNIEHYEWKRTLARQAVAIPGNFYPEERFLRVHMVKTGMQQMGLMGKCYSMLLCTCLHAFKNVEFSILILCLVFRCGLPAGVFSHSAGDEHSDGATGRTVRHGLGIR